MIPRCVAASLVVSIVALGAAARYRQQAQRLNRAYARLSAHLEG